MVESDFIFAAITEELGLLGSAAVLIAFLLMIGAGLRIAQQAATSFERLFATGLTTLLGFQAFIIMAGVVRLLPLTGVTLPFISYGGSSLLANYVLLALLLRISDDTAEQANEARGPPDDRGRRVTKQIRNLGVFLACCYALLFLQANRLTVFQSDELQDDPRNNRAVVRDFSSPRGSIETADGVVVAESVESDDQFEFQRQYPTGDLFAHITGFFAFQLGSAGVEKEYNDELAGRTIDFDLQELGDLFVDRERVGNVTLSLRADIQQIARDQLDGREGSVVAVDPRTRRDHRPVVGPVLRPQPAGQPRLHGRRRLLRGAQRRPRGADPGPHVPQA